MITVTITERGKPPVKLDFDKSEITVGRVRGNDVVLQKNNVSKRHAKVVVKQGQFIIIDQKSTNGTIVNARKITAPQVVREGDTVCIGDFVLTFQHSEPEQPQQVAADAGLGMAAGPGSSAPSWLSPPPSGPAPEMAAESGPRAIPPPVRSQPPAGLGPPPPVPAARPPGPPPLGPPPLGPTPGAAAPSVPTPMAPSAGPPPPPRSVMSFDEGQTPARGIAQDLAQMLPRPPREKPSIPPPPLGGGPPPFPPPTSGPPPDEIGVHLDFDLGEEPAMRAPLPSEPLEAAPPRSTLSGFGPGPKAAVGPMAPASELVAPGFFEEAPLAPVGPMERPVMAGGYEVPTGSAETFEQAQGEAIRRIFQRLDLRQLPHTYPPSQAVLAEHERLVDRFLDSLAPEGLLQGLDRKELISLLTYEIVGLGPLELYLDDPTVSAVYVNGPRRIFIRRRGEIHQGGRVFSSPETLDLTVERLLNTGQRLDEYLCHVRFADGTRIEILLPPVAAQGPVITLRKAPRQYRTLDQLAEDGVLSADMAIFLQDAVTGRRTILVAGPDGSGKTELLRALGLTLPEGGRIVTVEENAFIKLPQRSVVNLESAYLPGGSQAAMKYALRMDPDRLLVDELGPFQAYDWILGVAYKAMGSIATITASGARDALSRLESLAIPATPLYSTRGVREQIGRAVHILVVLSAAEKTSRVTQILEVQGLELDTLRLQELFYYQGSRDDQDGAFHPTGHIPSFYEELRRAGVDTDLSIFRA